MMDRVVWLRSDEAGDSEHIRDEVCQGGWYLQGATRRKMGRALQLRNICSIP